MRNTSHRPQAGDILQKSWPVLLETPKGIKARESLKSSHSKRILRRQDDPGYMVSWLGSSNGKKRKHENLNKVWSVGKHIYQYLLVGMSIGTVTMENRVAVPQKTKARTALCRSSHFSHAWLFATLWTRAHQAPLSMGFSRQEYWSGLSCPPPRVLLNPVIKPHVLYLLYWQASSLPLAPPG